MATPRRIMLLLAMSVPLLGSCTLFHKSPIKSQSLGWVPRERDPAEYAQSQMDLGRDALSLEQYGLAIACFRAIQQFPEYAPDAHNGLGIAYAQLGRPDLATRYFELAISERPSDARFSANLDRLAENVRQNEAAVAVSLQAENSATASETVAPSANVLGAGITVDRSTQQLVSVSRGENVATLTAPEPHAAQSERRHEIGSAPLARVEVDARRKNLAYPVRIEFGPDRPVATVAAAQKPVARTGAVAGAAVGRPGLAQADTAQPRRAQTYPIRFVIENPYAKLAGAGRLAR